MAQLDCTQSRLVCEVKVVNLQDFNVTHDGKGNFTFYFWQLQPDSPELGEFKVTGTYTSSEAKGSGEKVVTGDGAWRVTVSFTLQ